jgi:hypothetical protein
LSCRLDNFGCRAQERQTLCAGRGISSVPIGALSLDPRSARALKGLRAVEFASDQLAVPGQDGVRPGHSCYGAVSPLQCHAVLESSRRAQVFLLCDRRRYDRSIAGLGAGRAQRYFAPELDRSNRLTGWLVRIEAVVIKKGVTPDLAAGGTARLDSYFNAVPGR